MLVEAVQSLVKDKGIDMRLTIVGAGHPEKPYADEPFISTPGRVPIDEFADHHASASAYVQPSIGDGFGVAALEGMLAGLPTIVTELVGAKQLLADEWVTDPTVEGLASAIETLSCMSRAERIEVGRSNRNKAQSFTPSAQTDAFRDAVASVTGVAADLTAGDKKSGI
ncbi:glycosyltransferase family 4 protein [Halomicroarcula sp. GCM10025894]|uniref:glycosyltransferase family 4 protein n=1 Tax=Halomicroarcula sp. GCM10025894 TaxID=3252673 RepID=UPI0036121AE8